MSPCFRLIAFLSAIFMPGSLVAATFTWNNASGGDFVQASNWTPTGPPSNLDIATVNLPGQTMTITATTSTTVDQLLIGNMNLTFDLGGKTITTVNKDGKMTYFGIGTAGQSNVTIRNGTLITGRSWVGNFPNTSRADVLVDGVGANYQDLNQLFIESSGRATMTIRDGASLKTVSTYVGNANSQLTVTGPGTTWTTADTNLFGASSRFVLDRGAVANSKGYVRFDGDGAVATIDGTGTRLSTTSYFMANAGAQVTISNGAKLTNDYATVGRNGAAANVDVKGQNTTWTNNSYLAIGLWSGTSFTQGTVTISEGATVSASRVQLGSAQPNQSVGWTGTVNVTGAGSTLDAGDRMYIAGDSNYSGGNGYLHLSNGGTARVNSLTNWDRGVVTVDHSTLNTRTTNNSGTITLNDGLLTGSFTNNAGGLLDGLGTLSGTLVLNSGSTVSPGLNAPGTLNVGATTWYGGTVYEFDINDATGTAGGGTGWSLLSITGRLNLVGTTASPFVINVRSLGLQNLPGEADHFDSRYPYVWKFAQATGGISGFQANQFVVNTNGFANNMGTRYFEVQRLGNTLALVSVPELNAWTFIATVFIGLGLRQQFRRYSTNSSTMRPQQTQKTRGQTNASLG